MKYLLSCVANCIIAGCPKWISDLNGLSELLWAVLNVSFAFGHNLIPEIRKGLATNQSVLLTSIQISLYFYFSLTFCFSLLWQLQFSVRVAVKLLQVQFKVKRVIIMSSTLSSICFQGVKGDCKSCIQN